jgi:hypothetical protein
MPILKSVPLIALVALALSPNIVYASSVDIQSDTARVVIDRGGQIYIRNENRADGDYSDLDNNDWVISRPSTRKFYRRGLYRDRYYRGKCRSYNTRYSRYGSSSYSSTIVCN